MFYACTFKLEGKMTKRLRSTIEFHEGEVGWAQIHKTATTILLLGGLMFLIVVPLLFSDTLSPERQKSDYEIAREEAIEEFNSLPAETRAKLKTITSVTVGEDDLITVAEKRVVSREESFKMILLFAAGFVVIWFVGVFGAYLGDSLDKGVFLADLPREWRSVALVLATFPFFPVWVVSYIRLRRYLKQHPRYSQIYGGF